MYSFYDETLIRLGLPLEQTTLPRVVLYYNAGVFVEGHKGLFSCSEEKITFRLNKDKIGISGKGLKIREISDRQLFIRGEVSFVGVVDE